MDWIRENKTLATIAGVFLAGAVGIGALLVVSHLNYGESLTKYEEASRKVASQEKAALYPSQENVDALAQKVSSYEEAVGKLGDVLLRLQPKTPDIKDTEFQAALKEKIAAVRAKADQAKCGLPKDFAFGFDVYGRQVPPAAAAVELKDYFDSVDAIVAAVIENGVSSIDSFERSELKIEKGEPQSKPEPVQPEKKSKSKSTSKPGSKLTKPAKEITKVVERRQVTMTITTDQRPLQALMNILASPTKMPYFTVVRNLRIENEKQDGPLRNLPLPASSSVEPPSPEAKPSDKPAAEGEPAHAKVEVLTAPKPLAADAVAVIGGEKLKVYLEIDLIKFVAPTSETPESPSAR